MQWNKIKLTFILAFLILNIYLVFQLFPQEETEQLVLETESPDAVLNTVTGYKELSDEPTDTNQQYEAKKRNFTEDDLDKVPNREELDLDISESTKLEATFQDPQKLPIEFPIDDDNDEAVRELEDFVKDNVLFGGDYTYWGRQGNQLMFFQKVDEGQIYFNPNGLLLVTINEDYDVTGYTQTYIKDFKKSDDGTELKKYSEKQAVQALQSQQLIEYNDTIEVEKGLYPAIELSSKLNFAPAYKITVNGTKHYFYLLLPDYPNINTPTESSFLSRLQPETEQTQ
ncbi:two-component system regulatory protein YycI [Terribacillus saccharophilus]|uniref:two-component system regulatory protein YycI n=1 Tax=Terribacillus saccharophilus TaxID=361277 RepID=UPI003981C56B